MAKTYAVRQQVLENGLQTQGVAIGIEADFRRGTEKSDSSKALPIEKGNASG